MIVPCPDVAGIIWKEGEMLLDLDQFPKFFLIYILLGV